MIFDLKEQNTDGIRLLEITLTMIYPLKKTPRSDYSSTCPPSNTVYFFFVLLKNTIIYSGRLCYKLF